MSEKRELSGCFGNTKVDFSICPSAVSRLFQAQLYYRVVFLNDN